MPSFFIVSVPKKLSILGVWESAQELSSDCWILGKLQIEISINRQCCKNVYFPQNLAGLGQ